MPELAYRDMSIAVVIGSGQKRKTENERPENKPRDALLDCKPYANTKKYDTVKQSGFALLS